MAIRSMKVVLCRTLIGVLADRKIGIHAVAEATCISIVELRRLLEFKSALGEEEAERLVEFGMKTILPAEAKPVRKVARKRRRWTKSAMPITEDRAAVA